MIQSVKEKTGPQTITVGTLTPTLQKTDGGLKWYGKARKMRRDPTIAMVRALSIAPALASKWTVETRGDAPEGAQELIESVFMPARSSLLTRAMNGAMDYGWQPFEKVMALNDKGQIIISKFKALLVDITEIEVTLDTGVFNGFLNRGSTGEEVKLSVQNSLLFNISVEGTDWYGESLLRNAESAYDSWTAVDQAATRYDTKIAGSHWVVHYPLGTSTFEGSTDVPNDEIAATILKALEASGTIAIPRKVEALSEDLNDSSPDAWKIEILSDSGSSHTSFVDRQRYLDALKARAFELPERSVLEGQFGTKAEAEAHADFAITNIELRHLHFLEIINWHAVNQLLRLNYGAQFENTVHITPAPLADPQVTFLKEVYLTVLGNPDGFLEEIDLIDRESLKDKLGIPFIDRDDTEKTKLGTLVEGTAGNE